MIGGRPDMRFAVSRARPVASALLFVCLLLTGCTSRSESAVGGELPTTSPGLWRPSPTPPTVGRVPQTATGSVKAAVPEPTITPEARPTRSASSPTRGEAQPAATATRAMASTGSGTMDVKALQDHLLQLINWDRTQNGLTPVTWDPVAAQAGRDHAFEIASTCAMSHWNQKGYGPDVRYTLAGGLDSVMENVYQYWHSAGGGPRTEQDWLDLVTKAQAAWMQSAGHRANILAPEHTGVGVGIAYDAATGCLALAQEFANHYVIMEFVPLDARVGDTIQVRGRLEPGAADPLINMAWEPLPKLMTVEQLKQTGGYSSPANTYTTAQPRLGAGGAFELAVRLDNGGQPGLYHIKIWVTTAHGQVMAADRVVFVR